MTTDERTIRAALAYERAQLHRARHSQKEQRTEVSIRELRILVLEDELTEVMIAKNNIWLQQRTSSTRAEAIVMHWNEGKAHD